MEFQKLVEKLLSEDVVAGGEGSAFGSSVGSTATAFSGDNYAPGDARSVHGIYGGVISRSGIRKRKSKKRKTRKKTLK